MICWSSLFRMVVFQNKVLDSQRVRGYPIEAFLYADVTIIFFGVVTIKQKDAIDKWWLVDDYIRGRVFIIIN